MRDPLSITIRERAKEIEAENRPTTVRGVWDAMAEIGWRKDYNGYGMCPVCGVSVSDHNDGEYIDRHIEWHQLTKDAMREAIVEALDNTLHPTAYTPEAYEELRVRKSVEIQ